MPPGCLTSCLWPLGLSLLHTGIVLNDREYAYGAADAATTEGNQTGIFWTKPRVAPPGGTFRCSILQGITFLSPTQMEVLLQEASTKFPGSKYNLLDNNCNHFTNYMCRLLTHKEAPAWINRASKVGKVLPCLIPRDWLHIPDNANGTEGWELNYDDENAVQRSTKSRSDPHQPYRDESAEDEDEDSGEEEDEEGEDSDESDDGATAAESQAFIRKTRDSDGRKLPPSEQAPRSRLIF